jgi:DNA-binding response OmpR family regulator
MIERRSILIADDEVNLCKILEAELKRAGFLVKYVHDGKEAVEQARSQKFDIVILDVRMPLVDGLSVLREIRKFDQDVPVIMMTAYESHDSMASALAMGATACVNKPFDLESLVALVKATLDENAGNNCVSWTSSVRTVLFTRKQPILLEIFEGEHAGCYQSHIEGKEEQTLTIACPANNKGSIVLKPGTPISIGFAGEDAFYSFETTVLAVRDVDPASMVVAKPAVIYRVQRRKHPRTPIRLPVKLAIIDRDTNTPNLDRLFEVWTENIGVGGLKVIADTKLPDCTEVDVYASGIPGVGTIYGRGKVTRAGKISENGVLKWEYGIQFTKIDEDARHVLREIIESAERVGI